VGILEIRIILSITILIALGGIQDSFSLQTIEEKCEGGREISLDYTIQGKEVVKICDETDSGSIFFGLEGTSHGTMQIGLPFLGNHSNTAHFACAFEYLVLDNDEEISSSFKETDLGKRITFDIKNNTKIIQIFAPSYLNESSWQKIRACEKEFSKELSPKKQTFAGISIEEIYCRDDYVLTFKSTDNSPACVKPVSIAKLIERGWAKGEEYPTINFPKEKPSDINDIFVSEKPGSLQICSRIPGNEIPCSEGFVCYEQLSGGMGAFGPLPIESAGGDKLCHKECLTDNDCSEDAPYCLFKQRITEDYSEGFFLCFSDEEGKTVKDEKYHACLKTKETSFKNANDKDGKIFVMGDPRRPHVANFNGVMVQFPPYMIKNLNLNIQEVMKNEFQTEIIRLGGVPGVVIVSLPQNPVESICTWELDNRIARTSFNIDWLPVDP